MSGMCSVSGMSGKNDVRGGVVCGVSGVLCVVEWCV